MNYNHEVIMCVVNAGFSEAVMDAAREHGARGGTVIHARGTANSEAEKLFNISIQPEKEIVLIIVESEVKEQVLHGLYQKVGLQSAGQGIAFSLPVEDAVGLAPSGKVVGSVVTESIVEPKVKEERKPVPQNLTDEDAADREKSIAIVEAEVAMDKEKLLAELDALKRGTRK